MKDLVKATLVLGVLFALALSARVAAFGYLHSEAAAAKEPAQIAAVNRGCGVMVVKMPCFGHPSPEVGAMAPVPRQSGSAGAQTIASQDVRCAMQQVKFPCLQHADPRS